MLAPGPQGPARELGRCSYTPEREAKIEGSLQPASRSRSLNCSCSTWHLALLSIQRPLKAAKPHHPSAGSPVLTPGSATRLHNHLMRLVPVQVLGHVYSVLLLICSLFLLWGVSTPKEDLKGTGRGLR